MDQEEGPGSRNCGDAGSHNSDNNGVRAHNQVDWQKMATKNPLVIGNGAKLRIGKRTRMLRVTS